MSFTYNGATITARELTIGDEEDAAEVVFTLTGKTTLANRHWWFAQFVYGADVDGDEVIPAVTAPTDKEQVDAAYAAWRKLPASFRDAWTVELAKVENAVKNG